MSIFKRGIGLGIALAFVLPFTSTATAQENISVMEALTRASGLTTRQVNMVLGAGTTDARYRPSFDRVERRFQATVGTSIYQHLRHYGALTPENVVDLTTIIENRSGQRVAINTSK